MSKDTDIGVEILYHFSIEYLRRVKKAYLQGMLGVTGTYFPRNHRQQLLVQDRG